MLKSFYSIFILIFIAFNSLLAGSTDDIVIDDITYRFTITLPADWDRKDMQETKDKDGISYSLERKDKKFTILLLAFKLTTVKNIDDFIYNMEKDISLNIPQRSGDFTEKDFGNYDMKSAVYKDNNFYEEIFYFRTKLPDAPNNYVYLVRFITTPIEVNSDSENQIKIIIDSFKSTVE
ncbi:MAG TPA: hypothetical protein VJ455_03465 [Ignavibacteria bacterium]|nr:hypothetical protein [Ignavibacteria bacterium]